jgi:hypothetical protein
MSSSGAELPPGGDDSRAVNPYAASQVEQPRMDTAVGHPKPIVRHYQVRMEWADRRWFLKSVGFTRMTSLVMVVMTSQNALTAINTWWGFLARNSIQSFLELASLMLAVFSVGTGVLTLYTCWLNWKYADALQAVGGGATPNMNDWSNLHYRIELLNAAVVLMTLFSSVCIWLLATRY